MSVPVTANDATSGQTLSFSATGLPTGISISNNGTITGTPTTAGTSTVTVTATDGNGAFASTSFTWTVAPAGAGIATTPLVGYQGLCLDLASDSNTDGTKVDIYTCNGTDGQQWTELPNGTVHADGKCLDVAGGGTANGTLVDLYTCNGTGAQVWQPQSDGALLNPQSGKCLDDTGLSTTPGTQVQIWSCGGGANQSWVPASGTDASTGAVTGYQGLCLDVRGASSADGTPGAGLHLQRHQRAELDHRARRHPPGARQVPGRDRRRHRQRHPGRPGHLQRQRRPGLAAPGRRRRWSTRSPASAWTTPASPPPPAPRCRSGAAPAPPTSPGRCPRRRGRRTAGRRWPGTPVVGRGARAGRAAPGGGKCSRSVNAAGVGPWARSRRTALLGVGGARPGAGGHPPQRRVGLPHPLEPLPALAQHLARCGPE